MKFNLFKKKIKIGVKLIFLTIFLFAILFFCNQDKLETSDVLADSKSDGIAVRIITNPEHYSPLTWYVAQGFFGSPQSLIVNGYEAVRDGRTVYVNAANIDDNGTISASDDDFHTNIYLISYNQGAEKSTIDIFDKFVAHWKFNSNINTSHFCSVTNTSQCLHDYDCPSGEYCNSQKAKITRDTKRLADLRDIKENLEIASSTYGYFPKLGAGTYLPNSTVSVWPSWQDNFANEFGITLPIDPINKLGDCCPSGACTSSNNYAPETCWDEQAKAFVGTISSSASSVLPTDSFAYTYGTNSNGSGYYLCAVLETNYSNLVSASSAPYYCLHF